MLGRFSESLFRTRLRRYSETLAKSYQQSGYIKKTGDLLIKYLSVFPVFYSGSLKILLKNRKLLDPVAFFAVSVLFCVAAFETFWPDNPFSYYSFDSENKLVRLFLETVPKPLVSITLFVVVVWAIPSALLLALLGYKVRPQRLLRALLYGTSICFLSMTISVLLFLSVFELFSSVMLWKHLIIYNLVFMAVGLVGGFLTLRLSCVACGVGIIKYFLIAIVANVVAFCAVAGVSGVESAKTYLRHSMMGPLGAPTYNGVWPWSSMQPTLPGGSLAIIDLRVNPAELEPGDVIAFGEIQGRSFNQFTDYVDDIQRVIAIGGQTVEFTEDGKMKIDGAEVVRESVEGRQNIEVSIYWDVDQEPDIERLSEFTETLPNGRSYRVLQNYREIYAESPTYIVPRDAFFVIGDNRPHSWGTEQGGGFVFHDKVIGRVFFVAFPTDIGLVR